jgi:endonuclease/exonuclease/phosphatase family metal-dependent hydrolase
LLASVALLAGCAALPPPRLAECRAAPRPALHLSEDGRVASTTLDVLTFNLEGLAWPARRDRAPALRALSRRLVDVQGEGRAPEVVVVVEMLCRAARRAVVDTRYANIVSGPSRTQREAYPDAPRMGGPFRWDKGEIGIRLVGGGLAALSRYPIVAYQSEPFGRRRCAGLDCLSNKGMLHVRLRMAGVPEPIDLFNTPMNAQGASGVGRERHGMAHRLQVRELARFIEARAAPGTPTILGGDFNMRRSALRFARFRDAHPLTLVHQYCGEKPHACDVRTSWDGDEPWMDTQDLQLFSSGEIVTVRPIRVEAVFDGSPGSPRLSDHDGFRVTYRLSWPAEASPRDSCAP